MSLRDPIAGFVALAVSLSFFILSYNHSGGSEVFPRLVGGIMMACSALLLLRGIFRPREGERMTPEARRRIGLAVALTLLYIAAVVPLGFVTASVIYIPLSAISLGLRNYWMIGITTVLYIAGLYYLFHNIFYTPLPKELILKLF